MTSHTEPETIRVTAEDRAAASFLLRVWEEPREIASEPPVLRVFLRNLKTNEETYLKDLQNLIDLVSRALRTAPSPP
jgi:hypothetical protein